MCAPLRLAASTTKADRFYLNMSWGGWVVHHLGWQPAEFKADRLRIIRAMLARRAKLEVCDLKGATALHRAAGVGAYVLCEELLGARADVAALNNNNQSAVDLAGGSNSRVRLFVRIIVIALCSRDPNCHHRTHRPPLNHPLVQPPARCGGCSSRPAAGRAAAGAASPRGSSGWQPGSPPCAARAVPRPLHARRARSAGAATVGEARYDAAVSQHRRVG